MILLALNCFFCFVFFFCRCFVEVLGVILRMKEPTGAEYTAVVFVSEISFHFKLDCKILVSVYSVLGAPIVWFSNMLASLN